MRSAWRCTDGPTDEHRRVTTQVTPGGATEKHSISLRGIALCFNTKRCMWQFAPRVSNRLVSNSHTIPTETPKCFLFLQRKKICTVLSDHRSTVWIYPRIMTCGTSCLHTFTALRTWHKFCRPYRTTGPVWAILNGSFCSWTCPVEGEQMPIAMLTRREILGRVMKTSGEKILNPHHAFCIPLLSAKKAAYMSHPAVVASSLLLSSSQTQKAPPQPTSIAARPQH